MTNDFDRDLRTIYRRHEMDMGDRGMTPPPDLEDRARRRQITKIAVASVVAVGLVVVTLTGLDAIRASNGRPANERPPGPEIERTREGPEVDWSNVPGPTITDDAIVDVRTGEVFALPAGLRSFQQLAGYAVAPTGNAILFERPLAHPTSRMFYVAAVDGSDLRLLDTSPWGVTEVTEGSWSPDGTQIVAVAPREDGEDLVVIDVATGHTDVIARNDARGFDRPIFTADGRRILFSRFRSGPFRWDLYGIAVDGGAASLVHQDRGFATFSPDRGTMVFQRHLTIRPSPNSFISGPELWLADATGADPRRLANDQNFSSDPDWSPDGSYLAFSRRGLDAIVVVDLSNGEPTLLVRTHKQATGVWLDEDHMLIDVNT